VRSLQAVRRARQKYRRGAKGRQTHAAQERRRRRRNPTKAAARLAVLKLHGERIRARRSDPINMAPVGSLDETMRLAKRELWRAAALAEAVGDDDGADALRLQAHLLKPEKRRDSSSAILAAGDEEDLTALSDVFVFDVGPHGPSG
jgi:hypothetical protein